MSSLQMSMATMRLPSANTTLTSLRLLFEAWIRVSLLAIPVKGRVEDIPLLEVSIRDPFNVTLPIPVKGRVKDMPILEASIRVPLNITLAIQVKGRVEDMLVLEVSIRVPFNITLAIPVKGKVKDMPVFVLVIPNERQPLAGA
jgi:hypothetical protein